MQISQKLFNQQAINNFSKLDAEIQKIQEKVSTGKNILAASDDPVNAVSLSVANEQKELLQRYTQNADAADARLSLADVSIQEAVNTLRRITELSIQAGSGTVNETAILKEVDALKEVVVEIANNRDAQGQAVFSGFKTKRSISLSNSKDAEIEARLGLLGTPFSNSTMTRQLIKFPLYFLRHLSDQYNYPTF